MIYLDNAATTYPKPPAVIRAMATAEQVYSCRQALADFFDASCPEEVVFTQNCTHALNLAVKGCLSAGDHVIVSDLEHNSVLRPLHKLAQQGLIEYNVAPTSSDPDETVENYRRLLRGNTRLIVAAHGSNVTGRVQPIRRLGQLARLKGCLFLVDGAQSAGLLPISMKKDFIDFLCLPGHKGLYGPSGTGVLITPHGARMNTLAASRRKGPSPLSCRTGWKAAPSIPWASWGWGRGLAMCVTRARDTFMSGSWPWRRVCMRAYPR